MILTLLSLLLALFDLANLAFAAAKYWRLSLSFFGAASVVLFLCFLWDAPAIRWIAGFHLAAFCITAGIIWESRRGRLRTDKT